MSITPGWDLFIVLFFIALIAYSFLLQRDKAVITLISVYVAIVVTSVLSGPLLQFFAGEKTLMNQVFIKSSANAFTIQTIIFLVVVALISTKSGIEGKDSNPSVFELFGFSFFNATLIISTILLFMDPAKLDGIVHTSKIANILVHYHLWWMILPVVLLVFTGWNKHDH